MRSKDEVITFARSIGFQESKGRFTLNQLKFQLNHHLEQNKQEYSTKDFSDTYINVPGNPSFDIICFSDLGKTNFFASENSREQIGNVDTTFDEYNLSLTLCLSFLCLIVRKI